MKKIVLLIISALFGLMMLNSGLNKFFHYMELPPMPEAANQLMQAYATSGWMFPLLGLVEVLAGVLVIIPKTRALGAIMLFPITVGILLFHLVSAPGGAIVGIALMIVNLWIIWEHKAKYMPMIA